MKNKLRRDIFVIIFLLLVACIALAVPLAFSNPRWLLAPALLVVFALVVAVLGIRRLRRFVADMLCGTNFEGSKTQYSLADFSIPTALITEGSVVWYNPAFREQILAGQDALLAAPDRLMTGIDLSAVAKVGGVLLAIYLIGEVCGYIEQYIMATVTLDLSKKMRRDLSDKINKVPMKCFGKISHGDILSRVTNDVSTLQQALSNSLPSMISAVAQFVGCLIMMLVTEWRMALAAIAITLIGFVVMAVIMSRSQKYFVARQQSLGKLNGYVEEMYSGHDVVRISRANNEIKKNFAGMNRAVYDANRKSQFLSGVMQPLMNVIGNLGYVAVCVIGAALVMDGQITFGVITAFIMFVRLFTSPLSTLAQGMTQMQTAAAAGDRIFDFLQEEELSDESYKTEKLTEVHGEVEFDHVRFSYPDNPDKIIIKDFSAHIKPGQKVAIVGPTGAGKTTMVNLLMRFFDLVGGDIRIDGISTSDLTRENIHELFGMVLQDAWLFDGTIAENIAYGCPEATREEIVAAARAAQVDFFVRTMPQGYDTRVANDAESISQGQRQLLTIARVLLNNPAILILDEATSSVDTRTELAIGRAMDALMRGRTSFVIAHRLSTIVDADLILVMDHGNIIEQGTHKELLAAEGAYADLYLSQFA